MPQTMRRAEPGSQAPPRWRPMLGAGPPFSDAHDSVCGFKSADDRTAQTGDLPRERKRRTPRDGREEGQGDRNGPDPSSPPILG